MLTHRYCSVGVFLVLALTVQLTVSEGNAFFPFNLIEEHHAVAGRIQPEAYHGQRVVAITAGEGHGEATAEEHFLKIEKEPSGQRKAQTTRCCDISMPTHSKSTPTAHRHTQPRPTKVSGQVTTDDIVPTAKADESTTEETDAVSRHFNVPPKGRVAHINIPNLEDLVDQRADHTIHIVHRRNAVAVNNVNKVNDLPAPTPTNVVTTGFVVMDTKAFGVDHDGYIIVDDPNEFEGKDLIEFFVLLEDTTTGKALSNPLPFMIYIDRPVSTGYPAVPAVFAGVLVLIVVFLAFIIPFVTRAKRRVKAGKPVFKLGSHASSADLERVDTFTDTSRIDDSEPEWNGAHAYYNYATEVQHEKSHFGQDLKDFARSHPPTLQLTKKSKYSGDDSSSSGVEVSSQGAAEGTSADETGPKKATQPCNTNPMHK